MEFEEARQLVEEKAKQLGWKEFTHPYRSSSLTWISLRLNNGNAIKHEWITVREVNGTPKAFAIQGAIGKVCENSPVLGDVESDERWLGSGPGRYQLFQGGYIIWDGLSNLAYPRIQANVQYRKGRNCDSYIAFIDLRGFTQWSGSESRNPHEIQEELEKLEHVCQRELSEKRNAHVFLKGTGDGLMIIWELEGYKGHKFGPVPSVQKNADAVLEVCASIVKGARQVLPSDLAIGCGVTYGIITQVFILGQWDYIGKEVNEASKLQQLAWDEVVVSPKFHEKLKIENLALANTGSPLAGRGIRYSPKDVLSIFGSII